MRLVLFSIILLALPITVCEDASAKVDPDSDTSNLANVTYIAMDPDGGLKSVAFADSVVDGDSVLIYREMGIDVVWEMEVIFRKSPWRPLYMRVFSEMIQGELLWNGDCVVGDAIDENSATQSIDKTIDGLSGLPLRAGGQLHGIPDDHPPTQRFPLQSRTHGHRGCRHIDQMVQLLQA